MGYDESRNIVVMQGGGNGVVNFDDTWEWDNVDWELKSPATPGPSGGFSAMCFDQNLGKILAIAFSSLTAPFYSYTTHTWDGTNWVQVLGATQLPGVFSSMTFDPVLNKVVLLGWDASDNPYWSTWNGATWTAPVATSLAILEGFTRTIFDPTLGQTIKICGRRTVVSYTNTVYAFDGATWTDISPAGTTPQGRGAFGACWIDDCDVTVIFSGDGPVDNASWELAAGVTAGWTDVSPVTSPPGRFNFSNVPMMVQNPGGGAVLFGGESFAGGPGVYGDTWVWDCPTPPPTETAAINALFGLGLT